MITKLLVPAACVAVTVLAGPAVGSEPESAAASAWARSEHTAVRLISATEAVGDGAVVSVGLEFRLDPDWHIYWRSPGDAGYPPKVDWAGSDNLASAKLRWPAPERFTVLDLQTVGYAGTVVLPIDAAVRQPGRQLAARASVDYLACADICVPVQATLRLDVPAGPAHPSPFASLLAHAAASVPAVDHDRDLVVREASVADVGGKPELRVTVEADGPLSAPDVFVEAASPLAFGAPARAFAPDRRRVELTIPVFGADELGRSLADLPVRLTVVDGDRAIETRTSLQAAVRPVDRPAPPASTGELPTILMLAVLGGLILNLMPCVLPVLSMKLLSIVAHGGAERRAVRAGFVAAACGIAFSFVVLAGGLVVLRAGGELIGWGLQFQQPWFLAAMTLLVTLFACNLWGLFQVPMPRFAGLAGERSARVHGLAGHFLTGALATLLATPCSAPFLGTAVGFALARDPLDIFAVFLSVALGLAAPYLAVAAFPGLATRLPRPGRWMRTLRRVLACAMLGTAAWLIWVLAGTAGPASALSIALAALGVVLLLAVRHRLPPAFRRPAGALVAALAVAASVAIPAGGEVRSGGSSDGPWLPFDPARIPALVARGETVVVNVTADWCLTCKVNERLVLGRDPVRDRLDDEGVVAMRADWTVPSDGIARYLAGFGRYAIPFDAVYGPGLPQGVALPELLTEQVVIEALDRARGDAATAGR